MLEFERELEMIGKKILTVIVMATYLLAAQGGTNPCISTCEGLPNDVYQHCGICQKFIYCLDGESRLYTCRDGMVWDDNIKQCAYRSSTCSYIPKTTTPKTTAPATTTPVTTASVTTPPVTTASATTTPVTTASGTTTPVTTASATTTPTTIAPAIKTCSSTTPSPTSPAPTTPSTTTTTTAPTTPTTSPDTPAPTTPSTTTTTTTSPTAPAPITPSTISPVTTTAPTTTLITTTICISSCVKVDDGDYQSCNGCNVYVTCSNGFIYDNRPCGASLVWDDHLKRCEYTSRTC